MFKNLLIDDESFHRLTSKYETIQNRLVEIQLEKDKIKKEMQSIFNDCVNFNSEHKELIIKSIENEFYDMDKGFWEITFDDFLKRNIDLELFRTIRHLQYKYDKLAKEAIHIEQSFENIKFTWNTFIQSIDSYFNLALKSPNKNNDES
jgi:hypothetical protein